jgi:hypothetical protein
MCHGYHFIWDSLERAPEVYKQTTGTTNNIWRKWMLNTSIPEFFTCWMLWMYRVLELIISESNAMQYTTESEHFRYYFYEDTELIQTFPRFCDRFKCWLLRWSTWLTHWRLNKMTWTHFEQWEIENATLLLKQQFTLVHRQVHERWLLL